MAIFTEAMSGAALKGMEALIDSTGGSSAAFNDAVVTGLRNLPAGVVWDIIYRTAERLYDASKNEATVWADRQWSDIQSMVQRFFGGIFDDFTHIDDLLKKFRDSMKTVSPVVLDLDGNGFATTGLAQGTHFDHDANGFAERTAWVQGGEGLLVLDRDGDCRIDSGRELFGSETLVDVRGTHFQRTSHRTFVALQRAPRMLAPSSVAVPESTTGLAAWPLQGCLCIHEGPIVPFVSTPPLTSTKLSWD